MRVLIVDDHPIVVSGCKALLAANSTIDVIDAADGAAGYAAYVAERPEVAILDINLPGLSGLELCRRILHRDPTAKLIVFSMNDDPVVAARAIEAGAKGYVAKNDDPALFVEAVRLVAERRRLPASRDGEADRLPPGWLQREPTLGPEPKGIGDPSAPRRRQDNGGNRRCA